MLTTSTKELVLLHKIRDAAREWLLHRATLQSTIASETFNAEAAFTKARNTAKTLHDAVTEYDKAIEERP